MQQAADFLDECRALADLLAPLDDNQFEMVTQFKDWTIDNVVQHLFYFDRLAEFSVASPETFDEEFGTLQTRRDGGETITVATNHVLEGLSGTALRAAWEDGFQKSSALYFRDAIRRSASNGSGPA